MGAPPEDLAQASSIEQIEDAERARLVHLALQRLGQDDRKILLMTLVEGHKPGEIAATLASPPKWCGLASCGR